MALNLSGLTPQEQIASLFVGYFDRAPAPSGLNYWVGELTSGNLTLAQIAASFAVQPETIGLYPSLGAPNLATPATNLALVEDIFQNVFGRAPAGGADNFWVQQLNDGADIGQVIIDIISGAQGDDLATIENKIEVGLDWSASALANNVGTVGNPLSEVVNGQLIILNEAAYNSSRTVLDGVDATDASVEAAKIASDAFFAGTGGLPGQQFNLTTGTDNIVGTSGNDVINGLVDDDDDNTSPNTFGPGDVIDGGAGVDTLRITQIADDDAFGDGFGAGATVTNVEILEIRQADSSDADFDLSGFSGLQQIIADTTYDSSYEFYNLAEELVSITFKGTRAEQTERDADFYLYDISDSIYTGDDDTLTINVINAGSEESNSSYSFSHSNESGDEVFENYNVMVGGDDNYLYIENDTGADDADVATVTVANMAGNSGSIFLELDEQEDLETLDASGMTGDFKFEFDSTDDGQEITVTTGSGDDDIELDDGVYTVTLGAGDDRVQLDAFGADADDIDDVLDGGEGRDTISMDPDAVANLLSMDISNFEVLALNSGAAAAVVVDADDYGFEEITLEANIGQDLTIEDFNGGTLTIEANQTGAITVESNTLADTLDIVIDNDGNVTLSGGLDLTDVETVSFSSTEVDADLFINTAALNVTGVDSISFSGEGDVEIDVATTGSDDVSDVDLSGLEGEFDNTGFVFFGDETDIMVGNIGDGSVLELSAAAGRNVLEFGAELDNDITIGNFEEGAGIQTDVLDFSAFGITSLSDLTFTDTGADIDITSDAFDGTITLTGVANVNDLANDNFIFA